MQDDKYISVKEISADLGVSTTTVYDWIDSGLIPYRQPKKLIFILRKDYEAFLHGDA